MSVFDLGKAAQNPVDGHGLARFLAPSAIGMLFFLVPIPQDGSITLLLSIIVGSTKALLDSVLVPIVLIVLAISAAASAAGALKPDLFSGFPAKLFAVGWPIVLLRFGAIVLAAMTYWQVGPEMIWSKYTGGLMLGDLMTNLIPFFFWAGMLLPLLTDYGFMELIGTLVRKIMRPIFRVPGRAAVDCTASWIGSGTIGVVITDLQYRQGFYTAREAISIATGFSVVSVPIVVLFAEFLKAPEILPQLLLGMIVIGALLAIIMPRIPPISLKPDTYWPDAPRQGVPENFPAGISTGTAAIRVAVARASIPREEHFLVTGAKITADIWFALMPIVMTLGVAATIIAEYTPFFQWISYPFIHLLNLFGVAEAADAAPTLVIGFADVFLPFILGAGIESIETKFVIGTVALVQIIFMTEVGALLLKSPIPVNFLDLVMIFLVRTLIALPIAVLLARILL
jgi:nucleoside recognition membrane protein YjiH